MFQIWRSLDLMIVQITVINILAVDCFAIQIVNHVLWQPNGDMHVCKECGQQSFLLQLIKFRPPYRISLQRRLPNKWITLGAILRFSQWFIEMTVDWVPKVHRIPVTDQILAVHRLGSEDQCLPCWTNLIKLSKLLKQLRFKLYVWTWLWSQWNTEQLLCSKNFIWNHEDEDFTRCHVSWECKTILKIPGTIIKRTS